MKAVILAGGGGTRLWPVSREAKPKQFQCFAGDKTMLELTYERLGFLNPKDIFVSTNKQYEKIARSQLKKLSSRNFIIEPAPRDTGPCICYAAHALARLGFENEVMAVIYADHLIRKNDEFKRALIIMEKHISSSGRLGVIAVKAKFPNPNLGYIKTGNLLETRNGLEIYALEKFIEKPTEQTAQKYMLSYKYFWNTGLYCWKIKTILAKFKQHAPEIFNCISKKLPYEKCRKISIDYAVIEHIKAGEMAVVPADLGWNDIGTWSALFDEMCMSEKENFVRGTHLGLNTQGCVIYGGKKKIIATAGLQNMVIIDTADALLVIPKEKSADVKKIVEELKSTGEKKYI